MSVLAAASMLVTSVVVGATAASAQTVAQDLVVSADPANFTPHVLDGQVYAVAEVGDLIVLGGEFTRARNAAAGSPELVRTNLLAFDKHTGLISETFAPTPSGVVRALAPAPDGTSVYVGGQFNTIDGADITKIARLDVTTGARIASFKPGLVNAIVYDVKLVGNRLFIGGAFTKVKGTTRTYLAELDPQTGALRPDVDVSITGTVWGGGTQVFKLDVTADGSRMVVVGNFRSVGGQSRVQVAMLDVAASPATVVNWSTGIYDIKCGSSSSTKFDVRDVDFAPDGSAFFVGATGGHTPNNGACDGVTRWETSRTGTNQQPTWLALTGGDSVYSVAATGAALYVGGHFRWFNNPVYVQSFKGPGAVDREGIAALDPVTGVPLRWNPGRDRGQAVWDMLATDEGLWVGSDTDRIGRYEYHAKIAMFPLDGGTAVPQPPTVALPVDVGLISPSGASDRVARRAGFDGSSAAAGQVLAGAGTGWSSVRGAFLAEGSAYTIRSDKTMRKAPVSGTTFGTPVTIDLNGLTSFANELPSVTAMFYDQGRLYYTLSGQRSLYMRFFAVESDIVGATRYTVTGDQSGLDWRTVRGAFVVDGAMYWAHQAGGTLYRTTWQDGAPVSGTSTPVSDGDWRSAGMFIWPAAGTPVVDIVPTCTGTRCAFDADVTGLGSSVVTSYAWTFSDGSTASGAHVERTFAPGSVNAQVTVTTDHATTGTATESLTLTNAAPVAVVQLSCAGLTCTFDGGGSTDVDGSIASYLWDFGDGTTGSGATTTHEYATGGTRQATLTVVDNRGASGAATGEAVTASSAIAHVATAANTAQVTALTRSVTVPASVEPGDTMIMTWSANGATTPSAPAGWASHGVVSSATSTTGVWSKVADAGDAGSSVAVTSTGFVRADLVLAAYRGAVVGEVALLAETQSTAVHQAPDVTVADAGSWVVSYWADKSASTASWTAPSGTTTRHTYAGTGAGHVAELLVDSGPVPVGSWSGLVATASGPSANATAVTLVLAPAG